MKKFISLYCIVGLWSVAAAQCPVGQIPSGNNVVVNGDFSSGITGFNSQYTYSAGSIYGEGTYTVGVNAASHHPLFTGKDHTTGTGNFMMVNGAGTPNISVWCQTVSVTPQTQYLFETWVSSLYAGSPARLQFSINGSLVGLVFTAPVNVNNWVSFNATWNSGADTVATICIINQNTATGGNDFGLDDISFRPCRCNFTLTMPADTAVCEGEPLALSAGNQAETYQWRSASALNCDTCPVAVFTPLVPDTIHLLARLGGCEDSGVVTIQVDPKVSAAWNAPASICAGQEIRLSALVIGTPGGVWQGTGVNNDTLYTNGLNGVIVISYAVSQGLCADSMAYPVPVHPGLIIQQYDSICSGVPYSFPWGGITDTAGDYEHIYYSSGNCDSVVRIRLSLRELSPVMIQSQQQIFCANDSAELCAPSGFISYQWNTGGQNECEWAKYAGNYYLTVTDANGCTAQSNRQFMNVYPIPPVSIVVQGDTLSSFGAVSYQWIYNDVPIPGATSPIYLATQSGIYSLRITDANGCQSTSTGVSVNKTGLNETDAHSEVMWFSNPSIKGRLQLRMALHLLGSELKLFNTAGQIVFRQTLTKPETLLDVSFLASGIYFLHIGNEAKKLVIQ